MFMSGPGGVGKTHVVRAVQKVMDLYGAAHKIKFTAPLGSCAALIKGSTLHSALKIKVNKKTKGLERSDNEYTVNLSIQQKMDLEEEWAEIDILVIDEVSLLGAELLAEIDQLLRFIKGDSRPFGGVIIVFSGDFYQLPPVQQTALYTPVVTEFRSKKSNERQYMARLGRLAWKQVDTVIELTEQNRMRDDLQYAEAVLRLRKRQCNDDDVALFNSRMMKSNKTNTGIGLGPDDPQYHSASLIVRTNKEREALNDAKTLSECKDRVICASRDFIDGHEIEDIGLRKFILNLNMTKFTSKGALPGFISVYRGMPVILRHHNPCPPLGIANGSQGSVADFAVETDKCGLNVLKWTLVHFPLSDVNLPGLPERHVLLSPIDSTFTTATPGCLSSDGTSKKVRVKRMQADYEIGFAVTGHSSQGKTLPVVVTDLNIGGSAAYVAASRPTTRQGLIILEEVCKGTLNKPLPHDLFLESKRLEALEHNTRVRHGFLNEPVIEVPDTEHALGIDEDMVKLRFNVSNKRKGPSAKESSNKKQKQIHSHEDQCDLPTVFPLTSWDSTDYSCAYDAMMSVFIVLFDFISKPDLQHLSHDSQLMKTFIALTQSMNRQSIESLNLVRNQMRDLLSQYSVDLPRWGPRLASFDRITSLLVNVRNILIERVCYCNMCGKVQSSDLWESSIGTVLTDTVWNNTYNHSSAAASTQDWLYALERGTCERAHKRETLIVDAIETCQCVVHATWEEMSYRLRPPILYIDIPEERHRSTIDILPTIHSKLANCEYHLQGIVYLGGAHYTTHICKQNQWYKHDGQKSGGSAIFIPSNTALSTSDESGRKVCGLFYAC
ncbi:PIF1-like helicase-domain-containing protein [Favolaschia claudopus]|uniref:ATP-dependent DNA helicase n=1 Tax=Favolaschia claudopus TaxID=2862362 RepID=A0AAW0A1F3_9AGAR